MEKEKEVLPPDDLRCKRSDGRGWRCKKFSETGKTLCGTHLYRNSQKKSPKIQGNSDSTPDYASKSVPRVRILFRVKPEPESEPEPEVPGEGGSLGYDTSNALLALPVFRAGFSPRKAREVGVVAGEVDLNKITGPEGPAVAPLAAMRGPRTKRPSVVDGVEDRGNGNAAHAVIGGVESVRANGLERQGPRVKRPNVIAGVERGENADGNGDIVALRLVEGAMQGPRTKRPSVIGNVEGRENGYAVVRAGVVMCSRSSGKGWKCGREAKEGFAMCDHHMSIAGVKASGKGEGRAIAKENANEANEGKKKAAKKRKTSETVKSGGELVIKEEVESEKEEDFDEGNRLALVADLAVAEAEGREVGDGEDDLRCKRTDGRRWRCKRRISDGKTLCDLHFEQGRLRQKKITVPESLKIQKVEDGKGVEKKKLKRNRVLATTEDNSGKGRKKMKAELIRGFLRREIIEKKKKGEKGVVKKSGSGEITKDLPYGLMAIPSAQTLDNAAGSLDIKVGVDSSNSLVQRRFRSKNTESPPVGVTKVVPFAGNVGKVKNGGRRKCHWCKTSDTLSLTKCFGCKKRFFCASCIKSRGTGPEEVKVKCPVCRGSCDCKACCSTQTKGVSTKEIQILKDPFKGTKSQQLQYLINLLLPILEHVNEGQSVETESEARFKGQDLSEVEIRQAEVGCRDQCCCNNCKTPILDFHRSCPNCSYNLCLSCCQEYSQGIEKSCSQPHTTMKTNLPGLRICSEKMPKNTSAHSNGNADLIASSLSDSTACLRVSCPPTELGGCADSLLDLRCIFPLNWTKELEISAKETVSENGFPQTTDNSLSCSLCGSVAEVAEKNDEIQEASMRIMSHDNFIYCPSSSDDHSNMLSHFRIHWLNGHPVKVRNVVQSSSALSWDTLAIFCSCLENNPGNCVNRKDPIEAVNCSDWYEVEISSRELFSKYLEEGCTNRWYNTLRVKAKLSSTFSQRLLEDHYCEIIHALPLQEYTNSSSGLLNIAGKLPEGFPESKLGPHVCISFGSRDVVARGELLTKLHYNSYDMVNILAHVADATYSPEQLDEISMLMRHKNKDKEDQSSDELGQDRFMEGTSLSNGVVPSSCSSPCTNDVSAVNLQNGKTSAKIQSSHIDSDASIICSGNNDNPKKSVDHMPHLELPESTMHSHKKPPEPCGSQWDVFRRQDVPKLVEYITKHVEELSFSHDSPKHVVHPIFDESFYLDSTHKMQLKEEFDIEPWTFNQYLGEAVFIPAGCPYQMRNVKSCVNIELGFISPENASECIKLINDMRTLPNNHKAKEMKLEVEKMAICSIDEAINQVYRLKSEESILLDKGVQVPMAVS